MHSSPAILAHAEAAELGPRVSPQGESRPFRRAPVDVPRVSLESAQGVAGMTLQRIADDGTVWANRGTDLYRWRPGDRAFEFVEALPSQGWLGKLLQHEQARDRLRASDLGKWIQLQSGAHLWRFGGAIFRRGPGDARFELVHNLRFGLRVGRGLFDRGLAQLASGRILYGEYISNKSRGPIRLYASDDDGRSWAATYEFPARTIRHVHCVAQDPFTNNVYVTTGDHDRESLVMTSDDDGRAFRIVGTGSQVWRTTDLLFTEDSILWGVDSGRPGFAGVCRLRRENESLTELQPLDAAVEYAAQLAGGMVLASCRAGFSSEWDPFPSLWVSRTGAIWNRLPLCVRQRDRKAQTSPRLLTSPNGELVGVTLANVAPHGVVSFWFPAHEILRHARD